MLSVDLYALLRVVLVLTLLLRACLVRVVCLAEGLEHVVKERLVAYVLPREHVINVLTHLHVTV